MKSIITTYPAVATSISTPTNTTAKTKIVCLHIKTIMAVMLGCLLVTGNGNAQIFPPNCTPPVGSAISGQLICSGFSPTVSLGALAPAQNSAYLVTASVFSGNVIGFTPSQTNKSANADIESGKLRTFSTGMVEYAITPYNYGVNGVNNDGLGDDCVSNLVSYVYVTVDICNPVCDGLAAFSDYRNTNPAAGTLSASFVNRNNTNSVTITNTGTYVPSRPTWTVSPANIQLVRAGGATASTEYNFTNPNNLYSFNITSLQNASGVLEKVRVVGYDNAAIPNEIYPQFFNLQDGGTVTGANYNELGDDGVNAAPASGSFYFNEPVKRVVITEIGNSDVIAIQLLGCSFPSDFGDLTSGTWPQASAIVPGIVTANVPNAYNVLTAPSVVVWAGAKISTEPFTTSNGNNPANLDPFDDGLIAPGLLVETFTNNYSVTLNANQPGTKVFYRLWFDWNADGSFTDTDPLGNPASYAGSSIIGAVPVTFNIGVRPPGIVSPTYKARLAVSTDTITNVYQSSPNFILNLANGEIEDYSPTTVLLPVELGSFTVQKQGFKALIAWTALTETNFSHYEVEYSKDANTFVRVATVPATNARNYSVTDMPVVNYSGSAWYRLKMVDKDGSFKYGPIRSISWDGKSGITVGPNPVKDVVKIRLDNFNGSQKLRAIITDAAGRTVSNMAITNAVTDVATYNWQRGLYQVQITDDNKVLYQQKIIKN